MFFLRIIHRLQTILHVRLLRFRGFSIGDGARFVGRPVIEVDRGGHLSVGGRVRLVSAPRLATLGASHPTTIRVAAEGAVRLGEDIGITAGSICASVSITIGDRCIFGADVIVTDSDFHPIAPEGRRYAPRPAALSTDSVVIEDDVFIGARSIVLKGVTIGRGSVIGAGSVVTTNIPARSIAAGNPARVIRKIPDQEGVSPLS